MRRLAAAFVVLFASTVAAAAAPITYTAVLTGAAEDPPNVSLGTGTATVTIDIVAHTLDVSATFAGLSGITTASHIHCCTLLPGQGLAGVATETPTLIDFLSCACVRPQVARSAVATRDRAARRRREESMDERAGCEEGADCACSRHCAEGRKSQNLMRWP